MNQTAGNAWFARFDLGCAVTAGLLVELFPQLGGWPLLIGIVPWFIRFVKRQPIFPATRFDFPLVLFLLTAGVGVWAAYDPQSAWIKFWLIASAVLLYAAITRQSKEDLGWLAGLLSLFGTAIALVFLFGWNWRAQPSEVPAFTRLMLGWMKVRPSLFQEVFHLNDDEISGVVAFALPLTIACSQRIWSKKNLLLKTASLAAVALSVFVLVIATSRGAWLAAAATAGSLGIWFAVNAFLKGKPLRARAWFVGFLAAAALLLLGIETAWPGPLIRVTNLLPGPAQMENRLDLARNTVALISDYPFTGGGLDGFAGQYSRYILGIPFYSIGNSYNLYLDTALEQGILGALALVWVFLGSLWVVLSPQIQSGPLMKTALLASLLFLIYLGLTENIAATVQSIPVLFILPGILVMMTRASEKRALARSGWSKIPAVAGAGLFMVLGVIFYRPLFAAWLANLGAVRTAKIELAGFPSGQWEASPRAGLTDAASLFHQSLEFNPRNSTANYRLGLLSLEQRNFQLSTQYLTAAFRQAEGNRGIRKNLGLSYAWQGNLSAAAAMLHDIPEAQAEMDVYSWWWGQQGRPDLAENARRLAAILAVEG